MKTPFNEQNAEISLTDAGSLISRTAPDGRKSGFARTPTPQSGRWQVSIAGGQWPMWSRDGRELFYLAPDGSLMGVQVKDAGSTWTATSPVKILEPGYWSSNTDRTLQYDVSLDGKRFLVVTPPKDTGDPPELIVVQHWDEELKARVPVEIVSGSSRTTLHATGVERSFQDARRLRQGFDADRQVEALAEQRANVHLPRSHNGLPSNRPPR